MAEEASSPDEEQNYSLKEEIVSPDQLFVDSKPESDDTSTKFQEPSDQMDHVMKPQQSESSEEDDDDDSFARMAIEKQKEIRHRMEEELTKNKKLITMYKTAQHAQSKTIDDLQNRVEEYRIKCARLEAALADSSFQRLDFSKFPPDGHDPSIGTDHQLNLETMQLKLEHEKNRCQQLNEINALYREQLDTATEANKLLTADIQRLSEEFKRTELELDEKEAAWRKNENEFTDYLNREHKRLLSVWHHVISFRAAFMRMKNDTEQELCIVKMQLRNTCQNVTNACSHLTLFTTMPQSQDQADFNEILQLKQEIFSLKLDSDSEKTRLNEKIQDLVSTVDKKDVLIEKKDQIIGNLTSTLETMEKSPPQQKDFAIPSASQYSSLSHPCCRVVREIGSIIVDDADHHTWAGVKFRKLPSVKSALMFNSAHSLSSTCHNKEFLESLVTTIQTSLHKRCLQVEELNLQIAAHKERVQTQQKLIESLETDKENLHQLTSKLSVQLETVQSSMQEFLKDRRKIQSSLEETGTQKSLLEQMRKSLNEQIESLNSENDKLYKAQNKLYEKIEQLQQEKNNLTLSEQTLMMELTSRSKKITFLEEQLSEIEKHHEDAVRRLEKISMDKELLEEEKKDFNESMRKVQDQRSGLEDNLLKLKNEAETLKHSIHSLQELNESLKHEKQELKKSLSEVNAGYESCKLKNSKDKMEYEREKQEMMAKYDALQKKSSDSEAEINILKSNLEKVETVRKEFEQAQDIIVQRNRELINQVTKLSNQKETLEAELDERKKEMSRRFENNEKLVKERENLVREKAELTVKADTAEADLARITEVVSLLREEKDQLEKALYASQQLAAALQEEKQDLEKKIDDDKSSMEILQDQLNNLKHQKDIDSEMAARQKDALNQKIQQMEQEYSLLLKNMRQQYKLDLDSLTQEKELQLIRLETAQEERAKQLENQIDDLVQKHNEEITFLEKKMIIREKELEEKLFQSLSEKSNHVKDLQMEKADLEQQIQDLKNKISDTELNTSDAEKKMLLSVDNYRCLVEDLEKEKAKLQEEIEHSRANYEKTLQSLKDHIEELKQQRDSAYADITALTSDMNTHIVQRQKSEEKLEEISISVDEARKTREELEQQIVILQQKIQNEKKNVELAKKSQEDMKVRLKNAQSENGVLKQSLEQASQKIQGLERTNAQQMEENNDMRETLHELESSRIEARREAQNLRRHLVLLEGTNDSKDQEISEMQLLIAKSEEVENELRSEMFKLRQKVMEAEAEKEASAKELIVMRKRLQDTEQKLKLQHEEYNASLQETLSGERSHTEERLNYEKALTDASEEAHHLRLKLNYAEGKVAAFEKQISKLEGVKRELESKLQVLNFSLRSSLGIGSDSGFQGSSSQLLMSPLSSQRDSPAKFGEHSSTHETSSSHDLRPSASSTPVRHESMLNYIDLDVDLVRSALQDFKQKMHSTERERDDLRADLNRLQRHFDIINEENQNNLRKLQYLQTEMDITAKDKKELENQLASSKNTVMQLEERLQSIEIEKRSLSEKNANLLQSVTAYEVEKSDFQNKIAELRRSEAKLMQEQLRMGHTQEATEARATKAEVLIHELQSEKIEIQEVLVQKKAEIEALQQKLTEVKKSLKAAEMTKTSLQMSVERLNTLVEKHQANENVLQGKLQNLESSHAETTLTAHQVSKDLMQLKREHGSCEHEKSILQNEMRNLRSIIADLKNEIEMFKRKTDTLNNTLKEYDLQKAELEGQLLGYKNFMSYNEETEKGTNERLHSLEREKVLLEEQITRLKDGLQKNEESRLQAEKWKKKFEKENVLLRKAVDKVEKERQKTEEVASRSVLERAALGKSLSKMEIENQQLIQKVQNLQVQLAELEQRHLERVKDLDKRQKFELQLELERLRTTQNHMEQLLAAKEKTYQQKIMGLEQQVLYLQDHLKKAHSFSRQRGPTKSASVSFLNDILNYEDKSTEHSAHEQESREHARQLSSTPDKSTTLSPLSVPSPSSRFSHSFSSGQRMTSTPQVRRRLDKSFPS